MPGIVAIIEANRANSTNNGSLLKSMAHAIAHEDWQKTDMYSRPPLYIARVHLGITNAEPQPIFNEDESICIFMDGEVFDYEEEKKKLELSHRFKIGNDSEYCLHLFEEYGERFVEKLNGSFVLVIYDIKNKRILIANDRHGLIPFYYTKDGGRYIFSSEVKAILKDKRFKKEIDHKAVADFFAFGRILGNKTLFKRIKMLPPSSIVTWSRAKVSRKKYWDFKFEEKCDTNLTEEYYVNKYAALFRKAVERRTRGKHRFGVFLSGGLDSRMTLGTIDKKHYPISTFTFGVRGGDEVKVAKKVAEKLGTEHESIELREDYLVSFAEKGVYLTDGMLNCAHLHWISLLPTVRRRADVMFHGLGLEFLLSTVLTRSMFVHFFGEGSGVLLERQMSKAEEHVFPRLLYSFFNDVVTEEMMPLFFSKAYYRKIREYPRQSFKKHLSMVKARDPVNKTDSFWLRFFGRYYLTRVILRNYCIDRVPSLDNDFVDFALRVPRKFRFRNQRLTFKLLTKLAPSLAKIPYQRTGVAPAMPIFAHRIGFLIKGSYKFLAGKLRGKTRGLISLPGKIGYPDYGEWIRKNRNLRAFFEDILLDKKTLNRGYFNPRFVAQMVRDHMSGKKDWRNQLCALLTFELWHRLFIDSPQKRNSYSEDTGP